MLLQKNIVFLSIVYVGLLSFVFANGEPSPSISPDTGNPTTLTPNQTKLDPLNLRAIYLGSSIGAIVICMIVFVAVPLPNRILSVILRTQFPMAFKVVKLGNNSTLCYYGTNVPYMPRSIYVLCLRTVFALHVAFVLIFLFNKIIIGSQMVGHSDSIYDCPLGYSCLVKNYWNDRIEALQVFCDGSTELPNSVKRNSTSIAECYVVRRPNAELYVMALGVGASFYGVLQFVFKAIVFLFLFLFRHAGDRATKAFPFIVFGACGSIAVAMMLALALWLIPDGYVSTLGTMLCVVVIADVLIVQLPIWRIHRDTAHILTRRSSRAMSVSSELDSELMEEVGPLSSPTEPQRDSKAIDTFSIGFSRYFKPPKEPATKPAASQSATSSPEEETTSTD